MQLARLTLTVDLPREIVAPMNVASTRAMVDVLDTNPLIAAHMDSILAEVRRLMPGVIVIWDWQQPSF
jgi:hypothetical protein